MCPWCGSSILAVLDLDEQAFEGGLPVPQLLHSASFELKWLIRRRRWSIKEGGRFYGWKALKFNWAYTTKPDTTQANNGIRYLHDWLEDVASTVFGVPNNLSLGEHNPLKTWLIRTKTGRDVFVLPDLEGDGAGLKKKYGAWGGQLQLICRIDSLIHWTLTL